MTSFQGSSRFSDLRVCPVLVSTLLRLFGLGDDGANVRDDLQLYVYGGTALGDWRLRKATAREHPDKDTATL